MANLKDKLAFLTAVMGDPETIKAFVTGTHIDHGRHPDAERRIDLMLLILAFVGFKKDTEESWKKLNEWSNSTPLLLGEQHPIEYLANSDDLSESLWLGVAFNAILSSVGYMWVTDERVDMAFRQFQPMIDAMVKASK